MSSKRASMLPRAPVDLSPDSLVDSKATLTGVHRITTGSRAVIQAHARISSVYSAVALGAGTVVQERCVVGHVAAPAEALAESLPSLDVTLAERVVVEPGAQVAALAVGEGSVIGAGARVGVGAVLGRHCRVAPRCVVRDGELLPDYTVVYADGAVRRQAPGLEAIRKANHDKMLDAMKRLVKSDLAKHGAPVIQPADAKPAE